MASATTGHWFTAVLPAVCVCVCVCLMVCDLKTAKWGALRFILAVAPQRVTVVDEA